MERNPHLLLWNLQKDAAPARAATPAAFQSPTSRRNVQELRRHPPGLVHLVRKAELRETNTTATIKG
ncbi:hypothetical protein RDI58_001831 [Solanum bulbocastanum]|uniref:Uncharacterized protein n=1 Tax=Solanum bulbocastanum TaxID=147425 RepID=A0AAN8YTM4_SOLBU